MVNLAFVLIWTVSGAVLIAGQQYAEDGSYSKRPLPLILMHKQALTHDGNFNYVFAADNGLKQGETISPDGSRQGSYSYVDPSGKTISVKYTAGKDGFKILEGDHIPKPVPALPVAPAYTEQIPPYQQFQSPYPGPSARHSGPSVLRGGYSSDDSGIGSALAYIHAQDRYKSPSAPHYRVQEDSGAYDTTRHNYDTTRHNYDTARNNYDSGNADYNSSPALDEHKGPHSWGPGYAFEFAG
ncbi:uncharacterized protein LOC111059889 isoform X2 [Nilaparvata lugens]|uniref:Cuticular protein n=1 Tax=Nilaparvata lugens TaxID=108931 RepID=A0A2S1ZS75_NILLU|nr:uncharacterized protein LOC111059889 isoform X1 [Nilaparvata lugens]XP_039282104.1 uncharacterized protein LOC111059889 isoform X2 [Nilaparvata lugens]AWK28318.1 cuticular protein [Nilaparvata lugens]